MSDLTITHDMLSVLAARCCYDVPKEGLVFFGFRGLLPLDVSGTGFAGGHPVRLVSIDHERMRCTLGQWRPAEGVLALFPGSTVPNRRAVRAARDANGLGANMLMLGRYAYDRGDHKPGKPSGHRAFRQGMFFPVWRNSDDLDFDLFDRLDTSGRTPGSYPWDNLHCAYHDSIDTPMFSSNGCQVVSGRPSTPANGRRPETGPWARFVNNAYGPDAHGQTRFPYLLFSGTEVGLVSARPQGPFSRSARFGSAGEWVEKVQEALGRNGFSFLAPNREFGRDTLEAVMRFQAQEFGAGQADGVVGPNTAGALGLEWPPYEVERSGRSAAAPRQLAAEVPAPDEVPDEWRAAAARITPGFEVAGDPYLGVSGDFDGMGVSCGALQWNIGKGSLQPMVRAVTEARVAALMPELGPQMWRACTSNVSAGLSIVRAWQTGAKLTPVARSELRALMGSPEMRAQQDMKIEALARRALAAAERWATSAGRARATKREFLWFFDLLTQNGGLEGLTAAVVQDFIEQNAEVGAASVVCDFLEKLGGASGHIKDAHKNAGLWRGVTAPLALELLVLSYLRSGSASPRWRHVVLNRKGTLAVGGGWVNSSKRDFTADVE